MLFYPFTRYSICDPKILLPTPYLTKEQPFLEALTSYYPKRKFDFEYGPLQDEKMIYGHIAALLKDVKKSVLHCLNDLIDMAFKEEERKGKFDLVVPDVIKEQTAKSSIEYHKKIPEAFEDFPEELIVTWAVEEKQSKPSEFPVF